MKYLFAFLLLVVLHGEVIAAPTVVDTESAIYFAAGTGTTVDVAVPTHSTGDLIVAFGVSGNTFGYDLTPPAGFTALVDDEEHTLATVDSNHYVWTKVAGGSEGSNYTFTMSNAYEITRIVVVAINGAADPGDIAIAHAEDTETGATGSPVSPAVTVTNDDSLVLRYITTRHSGGSFTQPGSHSLVYNNGTTYYTTGIASITANAGSTGTATFTNDQAWQDGYWMTTLALAPPASGSAVPVIFHNSQLHR